MMSGSLDGEREEQPNNPYAVKKEGPGLFTKPLEDFDILETAAEVLEKQSSEQSSSNKNEVENQATSGESIGQSSTIGMDAQALSSPMSVSLPLWKRLPSRSVTLGPAEILTVSEACRHASIYATKSIRTTGVLSHRYNHPETNEVSLILKDPLTKLSNSKISITTTTTTSKKTRRISFGSTPATTNSKRRPSLGMARSRTTPLVSRTRMLGPSSTVETPVVAPQGLPRTPSSSLRFRTPAGAGAGGSSLSSGSSSSSSRMKMNKRPFKTPMEKKSPEEAFAAALTNDNVFWIMADSNYVPLENLSLGDFVTVIGTIEQQQSSSSSQASEDDGIETTAHHGSILRLIQKEKEKKAEEHGKSNKNTTNNKGYYLLRARILRQDNGANLRLHQEALLMRRRHLLTTYFMNQQQSCSLDPPLLGCGPPPYNIINDNDNNRNLPNHDD